jgi:hypothetical protein
MEPLADEWKLWALVNGGFAAIGAAGLLGLWIVRRVVARAWPSLPDRLPDWLWHFDSKLAWDIAERRDALLIGVGYIFRTALFWFIWNASTWLEIRWMVLGNGVFAAVLLVATLVWGDLITWSRPTAIGWLILYIEEPIWMLTLVPDAAMRGSLIGAGGGLPSWLVAVLLVEAVVTLVIGIYLFFLKPRPPDLVSSRVLAGFVLGWTFWCISLAMAETEREAQDGLVLNVIFVVGSMVVLAWQRVRPTQRPPGAPSGLAPG